AGDGGQVIDAIATNANRMPADLPFIVASRFRARLEVVLADWPAKPAPCVGGFGGDVSDGVSAL
ncbi:MAG TPA: hypothetical protein VFU81_13575, partial [Thermomicrobiales bacterium]|nr:hypothetical protein [Thermomicrobiales bacterium]